MPQFLLNSFKFWFLVNPWESAIRVRFGRWQKLLDGGLYFRIPYFDRIFIEENRLRIMPMPMQSVTTKDKKTLTVKCAVGYKISDVSKMYNTISQPESTITNLTMDAIASYLANNESVFNKDDLKDYVMQELASMDYGVDFEYIKVVSICEVRTFRLIQDQHWEDESLEMKEMF